MFAFVAAVLVFAFGLFLAVLAVFSAHRTFVPMVRHPGLLWWPAMALMAVSPLISMVPDFVARAGCERSCNVLGPGAKAPQEAHAKLVQADFDTCVKSGVADVEREAMLKRKAGVDVDPAAMAKAAEPGLREVCEQMSVARCVEECSRAREES